MSNVKIHERQIFMEEIQYRLMENTRDAKINAKIIQNYYF